MTRRKKLRWIKHYNNRQKILLVGEGDFSFSSCLASAFGSATNMVATCFHSEGSEKYISMVSEPFSPMDTRFRNGVYEFLTSHESTFLQIQKNLQAIRDELQSLSNSQIQLATYLSVFLDDTYESTEVFVDFDKPPVFDEDVFEKISFKSNSYFMDCFYESHVSHCKNISVYLLLQDLMIQEFVSSQWSDWMDIMTKGEKFKVRRMMQLGKIVDVFRRRTQTSSLRTRILQAVGNDMCLLATPCLLAKPCLHMWNCDVSRITCKTCMEMLAVRWTEFTIS